MSTIGVRNEKTKLEAQLRNMLNMSYEVFEAKCLDLTGSDTTDHDELIGRIKEHFSTVKSKMIDEARDFDALGPIWPWDNVWIGTTITNQVEADRDILKLLAVSARVRFLSMEPLLGPCIQIGFAAFRVNVKWLACLFCSSSGVNGHRTRN